MSGSAFKQDTVTVDDVTYNVHELSVRDRRFALKVYDKDRDATNLSANMVHKGCDEFDGNKIDDVLDIPCRVCDLIADKITEISGMVPGDPKK